MHDEMQKNVKLKTVEYGETEPQQFARSLDKVHKCHQVLLDADFESPMLSTRSTNRCFLSRNSTTCRASFYRKR